MPTHKQSHLKTRTGEYVGGYKGYLAARLRQRVYGRSKLAINFIRRD